MKRIFFAFLGLVAFCPAFAQLAHLQSLPVVSNNIKIGKMTVALPAGEWRVLNTREGRVPVTGGTSGAETETKFLIRLNEKNQFVASVWLYAPKASTGLSSWNDSVCQRADMLWVKQTDGNFNFPACLFINHGLPFWTTVPANDFDKLIFDWYRNNKVELPKSALAVGDRKYFSGDFINMAYAVNPELLGFTVDAGNVWANSQWHAGLINDDPKKDQYVDSLKKWAESIEPVYRASLMKGMPGVESISNWPENK